MPTKRCRLVNFLRSLSADTRHFGMTILVAAGSSHSLGAHASSLAAAITAHPEAQESDLNVSLARGELRRIVAEGRPQIELSATRRNGIKPLPEESPDDIVGRDQDGTNGTDLRLSVDQLVYDFGRLGLRKTIGRQQIELANVDHLVVLNELAREMLTMASNWRLNNDVESIASTALAQLAQYQAAAEARVDAGVGRSSEMSFIKLLFRRFESQALSARSEASRAKSSLMLNFELTPSQVFNEFSFSDVQLEMVDSPRLASRQAELATSLASLTVREARAARRPEVRLELTANAYDVNRYQLDYTDAVGRITASVDLWDGGRGSAQVDIAKYKAEQSEFSNQFAQKRFNEYKRLAESERAELIRLIASKRQEIEIQQVAFEELELGRASGLSNFEGVVSAYLDVIESRIQLAELEARARGLLIESMAEGEYLPELLGVSKSP